jgi:Fe-S cluster assembly protein SufD
MARHSFRVQLAEECEALLQGVTSLHEKKESHIYGVVEHLEPSARSRQHFKALLQGDSISSFEGKIFVAPEAQKTESYQLSNNLLLSDTCKAYAKPNLEIFADDVKASHGATFSQCDPESLFYLRARGLSEEEAKLLLQRSFIQELAECL